MITRRNSTSSASFITPLTDISANIFAMMILILIIALISQQQTQEQAEKAADIIIVKRKLMAPQTLTRHLYERRPTTRRLRIDISENGLTLIDINGQKRRMRGANIPAALPQALSVAKSSEALRLYIFSHRYYAETARILRLHGRFWQEISVPQALRTPQGDGWSSAFSALLQRSLDQGQFRFALAQLLASRHPDDKAGTAKTASPSASLLNGSHDHPYRPLLERFLNWLARAISILAISAGLAYVIWVESVFRIKNSASSR